MKPYQLLTSTLCLCLAGSLAFADTPQIPTQKLSPAKPALKQDVQQKTLPQSQKQAIKPLAKAQVRPVRANHSGRPAQDWCTKHSTSLIEGRVTLYYNLPGPPDGPQYQGVLVVNSNNREYRTDVTVYPGTNKMAISNPVQFRWQDACPPKRVSVRLLPRNPADKDKFMPVTVYAAPDRADSPTWY